MKRKLPITLILLGVAVAIPSFLLWQKAEPPPIEDVGGVILTYELQLSPLERDPEARSDEARQIISDRLDAWGARARTLVEAPGRLRVELPGVGRQVVSELRNMIELVGELSFRLAAPDYLQEPARLDLCESEEAAYLAADAEWAQRKAQDPSFGEPRPKPPDYIVRFENERKVDDGVVTIVVKPGSGRLLENFHSHYDEASLQWKPQGMVSGRHLTDVSRTVDPVTYRPAVLFELDSEGAEAFGELTESHIGGLLAIVLDGSVVQVSTILDRITNKGHLTGDFTEEDVRGIVTILGSGSLPAPLTLVSEEEVPAPEGGAPWLPPGGDAYRAAFVASLVLAGVGFVALVTRNL